MKKIILLFMTMFSIPLFAENSYSLYKNNGKYGLINDKRKIVLEAKFDNIMFNEVYLCKSKENGFSIYDNNLKLLKQFSKTEENVIMCSPTLFYFSRGYAVDKKYYILDIQNSYEKEVWDSFQQRNKSSEPWIAAKTTFYSKDLIEQQKKFHHVYPYRENRAVVLNNIREGEIIDENFSTILDKIFAAADFYSEGLIPVIMTEPGSTYDDLKIGKSYYVDIKGNFVYECDFDFNYIWRDTIKEIQVPFIIGSFNEGVAVVQKRDKSWMVLDKDFNKYYLPEGCEIEDNYFHNGLFLVSKTTNGETKYGFIDKKCNIAIPLDFSYAESFFGSYAIVKKNGVYGVVDNMGEFYPNSKLNKDFADSSIKP